MSRQNLLKSGWFLINTDEVRVIDSNDMIASKIGETEDDLAESVTAKPYIPQSFDNSMDDNIVAKLFDDVNDTVDDAKSENTDSEFHGATQNEQDELEKSAENVISLEEIEARAQEILDQADDKAKSILEQAESMGQQQARQAYDQAKQQGMQDGYQEGYQKALDEIEAVKQEYAVKLQTLQEEYKMKMDDMEPYLVEELTGIYEHVFHVELSQYKSVLVHLIANTLHSVENSSNYLIHVSNQDFSFVSMQKAQIMEEGCTGNTPVEIVEDMALSKNECLIETENGIFDCSLSVQLTELKRKLQLLSYKGTKE